MSSPVPATGPADVEPAGERGAGGAGTGTVFHRAMQAVTAQVRGKDEVVELALVSALAGGHVLLEDVPGVGKTTLARALAAALGGEFRRIQFTSDMLPGDVTGVTILEADRSGFRFRPGPIFGNVVLADEINRATPKTQSALLEAMNESSVTVDGTTHPLPSPFVVIATQNPHDFHGTFPLPDSQLDRFLVRLTMGYPDRAAERQILRDGSGATAPPAPERGLDAAEVRHLVGCVDRVRVHDEVEDYLLELVGRTRTDARLVRGVSTRGAQALHRAMRALAVARDRNFVVPEDLHELAVPVLAHRVLARTEGERGVAAAAAIIQELLWEVPAPR